MIGRTPCIGAMILATWPAAVYAGEPEDEGAHSYLPAVRAFADNALRYGRDRYGPGPTPLFVDGLNPDTHEPAVWKLEAQHAEKWNMPREWVMSDLANQQNLFRVLVALTQLTGDAKYKQAAVDATRYAFDHLRHPSGLLFWGGHAAWDLRTNQPVGEGRSPGGIAGKHELKSNFPYYELMWEVDREATRRFVESFWSNHILRWDILDMNRHGYYKPVPPGPWDHEYVGGPVPFAGEGLTFINTGGDLWYAAALLYQLSGEKQALTWAKRIAGRYAEARDPRTGLGADNYSTLTPDRMTQQFGAEFGNRFTEATVTSLYGNRYTHAAICRMKLFDRLGPAGEEFKRWAIEDMTAYARYAYDPADNAFWATLIDGTRLTPADRKREGYVEARWLEKRPATGLHLWAYALAYRLSGDERMWQMTRNIARGLGLGDWGRKAGAVAAANFNTDNTESETIFALLELHKATQGEEFLRLAQRVGDNLMQREYHGGFFVANREAPFCRLDSVTPLALLHLEVALRKLPVTLPEYDAGRAYFHCSFDGKGRTRDNQVLYGELPKAPRVSTTTRPAAK